MNPVVWFEIPVRNMERAKKFYERVFSVFLQPVTMGPATMELFPHEPASGGAGGALVLTEGYRPSHDGAVVYFGVTDIPKTLETVEAAGGSTVVPLMSIGESGSIAMFEDLEGNRVGLHASP